MGKTRIGERKSLGAATVAAFVCIAMLAAPADAAWSPPVTIAQQRGAGPPKVAMDSAGNAVFTWQVGSVGGGVYTRSRMADGTLTSIQRITPPGEAGGDEDLAVDPAGNAYYVWQVFDDSGFRIRARVRSADGALGPVQTLANVKSGDFLGGATVGVSATGRAVFSWFRKNGDDPELVQARSLSSSGQLGPVHTVVQAAFSLAQMAVDGSGNATFAWRARAGGHIAIFTRTLASNGALSQPKRVSRVGFAGSDPHVGVSRQGRAVFEWQEFEADGSHPVLMVRGRTPDGNLQPTQLLAKTNTANVDMAVSPNGAAVVCWIDGNFDLRERSRTSGGTLGPLRTVAQAPSNPGLCHPGIDSHGTLVFAWTASDGSNTRVYARSGAVGGTLGPVQALSPAGFNANLNYSSNLAADPAGVAPVGWSLGRKGFAVQASFGP